MSNNNSNVNNNVTGGDIQPHDNTVAQQQDDNNKSKQIEQQQDQSSSQQQQQILQTIPYYTTNQQQLEQLPTATISDNTNQTTQQQQQPQSTLYTLQSNDINPYLYSTNLTYNPYTNTTATTPTPNLYTTATTAYNPYAQPQYYSDITQYNPYYYQYQLPTNQTTTAATSYWPYTVPTATYDLAIQQQPQPRQTTSMRLSTSQQQNQYMQSQNNTGLLSSTLPIVLPQHEQSDSVSIPPSLPLSLQPMAAAPTSNVTPSYKQRNKPYFRGTSYPAMYGASGHGAEPPKYGSNDRHRNDRQQQQSSNWLHDINPYEEDPLTYKTEICRTHLTTGQCEYGERCQFAHGIDELRYREFDAKYKTELCKLYHLGLNCEFETRCKFIHNEYRVKAGPYEFWLVSPQENLVRVEMVDPSNTERLELLTNLVNNPPKPPKHGGRLSPLKQLSTSDAASNIDVEKKESNDDIKQLTQNVDTLNLQSNNNNSNTNILHTTTSGVLQSSDTSSTIDSLSTPSQSYTPYTESMSVSGTISALSPLQGSRSRASKTAAGKLMQKNEIIDNVPGLHQQPNVTFYRLASKRHNKQSYHSSSNRRYDDRSMNSGSNVSAPRWQRDNNENTSSPEQHNVFSSINPHHQSPQSIHTYPSTPTSTYNDTTTTSYQYITPIDSSYMTQSEYNDDSYHANADTSNTNYAQSTTTDLQPTTAVLSNSNAPSTTETSINQLLSSPRSNIHTTRISDDTFAPSPSLSNTSSRQSRPRRVYGSTIHQSIPPQRHQHQQSTSSNTFNTLSAHQQYDCQPQPYPTYDNRGLRMPTGTYQQQSHYVYPTIQQDAQALYSAFASQQSLPMPPCIGQQNNNNTNNTQNHQQKQSN